MLLRTQRNWDPVCIVGKNINKNPVTKTAELPPNSESPLLCMCTEELRAGLEKLSYTRAMVDASSKACVEGIIALGQ
jgi:hypothetical protein